ncbi:MAG: TRAP transporter TatT component family protein [Desulfofustis sp.]
MAALAHTLLKKGGAAALLTSFLLTTSCTALLTNLAIEPAVSNLQKQSDVELVCEGAAAYLLMVDSLIESDPADKKLLTIGAKSYSGTAAALESCGAPRERLLAISTKSRRYGKRLLATMLPIDDNNAELFDERLQKVTARNADSLFWGSFGWLSWIEQEQGSPAAMADLVTVEKIMNRLLELDDTIEQGGPHLFFGVLYGSKPAMIGGDPERSRYHFEKALAISGRSFLMAQTLYAATYGRMVFNRQLHDQLLDEVLAFDLDKAPDNRLSNQIAKRRAKALLEEHIFVD